VIWLPDERSKEHAADTVSMSYTARHPRCGHVRAVALDKRNGSLDEFIAMSLTGLILSREPTEAAKADLVECDVCRSPEQDEMGL
jgi:hypothetical protein